MTCFAQVQNSTHEPVKRTMEGPGQGQTLLEPGREDTDRGPWETPNPQPFVGERKAQS